MKRLTARYQWTNALAILVFSFILDHWFFPQIPVLFLLVAALIGSIYFAVRAPNILLRKMKRNLIKMYAEGQNKTMLGEQELEVSDVGLVERSKFSETKMAWGAIERIETTPDHTFVYTSSTNAYIIPHHKIIQGDYRTLMAEISRRFQPGQNLRQTVA
jgi:hypothetical protein